MKAEVARRYTDRANSIQVKMQKLFTVIKESADSGLDFIILDYLDKECRENLIDLGYSIYDDGNEKTVTIEW
jgi:hypothetical protein